MLKVPDKDVAYLNKGLDVWNKLEGEARNGGDGAVIGAGGNL